MDTTLTIKGQVTIPKRLRDALDLAPGSRVRFTINREGEIVVRKAGSSRKRPADRFAKARGLAQVQWRTDALMALLRD
ncbi:MAG: AbrB/MazE/SpoVT family DNA-binding domain-containing protein [Proteobacteria bacterium]|nr:AbrB/MazE/SpoVT family DNA-binding domain-containing protein [Pseudomonadota bacterium]